MFSLFKNFEIKYYMIVDPEKEHIEIYLLENLEYVLQSYENDKPFSFAFTDECKIELLLKNIWE